MAKEMAGVGGGWRWGSAWEGTPFKHHAPSTDVLLMSAWAWHTCLMNLTPHLGNSGLYLVKASHPSHLLQQRLQLSRVVKIQEGITERTRAPSLALCRARVTHQANNGHCRGSMRLTGSARVSNMRVQSNGVGVPGARDISFTFWVLFLNHLSP